MMRTHSGIHALARALPLQPYGWRPIYLGVSRLELRAPDGSALALELSDGGGHVPGVALWRIAGRAVGFVEAGQA